MKALIIEDDPQIVESVALCFELRWPGASLVSASRGKKGLELAETESPDVIILDLGLPDIDGLAVLQKIRSFSNVPLVILTVRDQEMDKVKGLEMGADDYIVKPFTPGEFLARVKAVIRRSQMPEPKVSEKPLVRGKLKIDFAAREVSIGDRPIKLTPSEYNLLRQLWNLPPAITQEKQSILPVERAGLYEVSQVERLPWYKRLALFLTKRMPLAISQRIFRKQALPEIERDEQLLQRTQELLQLKSDFLLTLAHEFKTPLSSLKSSANLLVKEVNGFANPSLSRLVDLIDWSTGRLDGLVSKLLYMARLEEVKPEISPTPYNAAEVIQAEVVQMAPLFESKGQHLEIEALPSGVMANIPPDRFKEILDNLLSNAHQFTPEGGRISVAFRKEQNRFTIEVSDTGIGIPEEEQERVFDMLYRCKNAKTQGIAGDGLGLSIAKRVVEMYGGKIWVTSTVGKGSTFYFSLPMVTNEIWR